MNQPVLLPLWVFILILLFAAVTFASHFLFPSVRWFFRKRAERLIKRLNKRLQRPIEPFKLATRYDMIQRLIYDPQVTEAVVEHARKNNVPENVAFEKARHYAREIVPSFSATVYFSVGTRISRWLSKSLYRVRLGTFDRATLKAIDTDATVIFVMNHRSNMDYMLVTYLASRAGALSYAVGEWARVWPLSALIRGMGAYFIRRRSRGQLYRRVLQRYVQMATDAGVSQAVFPEGGLSLDGATRPPKLGLLSYVVTNFKPDGRDIIFVPVGLNYDRVLEDQFLITANKTGVRRFRPSLMTVVSAVSSHLWARVTGRFRGFGTASVGFGAPLELSQFASTAKGDLTEAVGAEMMARIKRVIPVLSGPLVSYVLMNQGAATRDAALGEVTRIVAQLKENNLPTPRRAPAVLVDDTLERFALRGLLTLENGQITLLEGGSDTLSYYANSIAHHFVEGEVSN